IGMVIFGRGSVKRENKKRGRKSFLIGDGKLIADGHTYDLAHVHSVNHTFLVSDTGKYVIDGNTLTKHRNHLKEYYDAVSCKVVIRYGSNDVPIAQNLNEADAIELKEQIARLLGFDYTNR